MQAGVEAHNAIPPGRLAIGLDVGGTKVAGGLVTEAGRVLERRELPTRAERSGEAVLEDVLALARWLCEAARKLGGAPVGIGLGLCELVDPRGRVMSGHTVRWQELPVEERLSTLVPAWVEADSRAAALCEARLGAGRAFPSILYVTIGTGIGCSLVLDGIPYRGARGATGTMATSLHSMLCGACGAMTATALEEVASGPALVRRYNERGARPAARAEDVIAAASDGDPIALRVVEEATRSVGATLGLLVNVLDPHAVVVGGGLGSAATPYWHGLVAATREHIWSDGHRDLPIVQAAFGPDAGLVGAAALAHERSRTREVGTRPSGIRPLDPRSGSFSAAVSSTPKDPTHDRTPRAL